MSTYAEAVTLRPVAERTDYRKPSRFREAGVALALFGVVLSVVALVANIVVAGDPAADRAETTAWAFGLGTTAFAAVMTGIATVLVGILVRQRSWSATASWSGSGCASTGLSLALDLGGVGAEQSPHVGGLARRADRRHRAGVVEATGGGDHSGAPEAVSDEKARWLVLAAEVLRRADRVLDVGREVCVCEVALARTQPGEVEPQHRDPRVREASRDRRRRFHVLAAGETVCEERKPRRFPIRAPEPGIQRDTVRAGERDPR